MISVRVLVVALAAAWTPFVYAGSARQPTAKLDFVTSKVTRLTFAVPKGSPLKPGKDDMDGVHFTGSVRVTGSYFYGHANSYVPDSGDFEPNLYFKPDLASRALLPYWFERGQVQGFRLSNPGAFLRAAIAPQLVAKVKSRKLKSVTGKLTIWIDDYVATGECDGPVYTARFQRIERAPLAIAHGYVDPIGCS